MLSAVPDVAPGPDAAATAAPDAAVSGPDRATADGAGAGSVAAALVVAGNGAGSGCGSGMPPGCTAELTGEVPEGSEHDPSHSGSIKAAAAAIARTPGMDIMNAPHFQLSHDPVSTLRRGACARNMCRVTVVRQLHHGMVTHNAPGICRGRCRR
jgi:hypothetical protein